MAQTRWRCGPGRDHVGEGETPKGLAHGELEAVDVRAYDVEGLGRIDAGPPDNRS